MNKIRFYACALAVEKEVHMQITYEKLWKRLAQMNFTKTSMRIMADIGTNTLAAMSANEPVSLNTLMKICAVLNCSFDDIVTVVGDEPPLTPLPDVCFDDEGDFSIDVYGFVLLGYRALSDFPRPITAKSIGQVLTKGFCDCSLSIDECEALIAKLEEHGVHAQLTPGLIPRCNAIQSKNFYNEDQDIDIVEDIEWRKVYNYIKWRLRTYESPEMKKEVFAKALALVSANDVVPVEVGLAYSQPDRDGIIYEGQACKWQPLHELGLLPLWQRVLGENKISICTSLVPAIQEETIHVFGRLTIEEEMVVRLVDQYGLKLTELPYLLGLPPFETIHMVLEEHILANARRKLRHLIRSRNIRDCFKEGLFHSSHMNKAVYERHLQTVTKSVEESFAKGATLIEALMPFYAEATIADIQNTALLWQCIPEVSIDCMELSWQTKMLAKLHGITTLKAIIAAHGENISLVTPEKSGLPFEQSYIKEILSAVQQFGSVANTAENASRFVQAAENMLLAGMNEPSLLCRCIPGDIVQVLLELHYRDLTKVVEHYEAGLLKERLIGNDCEPLLIERTLHAIKQIATGQVEMTIYHFEMSEHLKQLRHCGESDCLQKLRRAYFDDTSLPYAGVSIKQCAAKLFPDEYLAFSLVDATREGKMQWARLDIEGLPDTIVKVLINARSSGDITSIHMAECDFGKRGWYLFAQIGDGGGMCFSLIKADEDNDNTRTCMLSQRDAASLAQCISFIEQLKCSVGKKQVETRKWRESMTVFASSAYGMTIEELDLSLRGYNCLKRAGINYVAELTQRSLEEVMHVRNLGRKALEEVELKLEELGLGFRNDE